MMKFHQNRLNLIRFNQSFETKLVVKRFSVDREFVQLPVPVKHLWMCSVHSNCEMVRMFNPSLRDRTQFVESNNYLYEVA